MWKRQQPPAKSEFPTRALILPNRRESLKTRKNHPVQKSLFSNLSLFQTLTGQSMIVWGFRTPGTALCHYVPGSVSLFAQLMPSLWVPWPPCWGSRGEKSSPLLGSPVTPWSICSIPFFFFQRAEATQGSFGNLCKCLTMQIFLISISWSLKSNYDFLQTACNKSSYIFSPHKNKSHALSRSLYFKPARPTSDLGSSCSNSALQAHSSCARHEQQTFCSFSSSIFFQNQTLQRRHHCLSLKKDIF